MHLHHFVIDTMDPVYSYTATAPVNIATLKYWGKRNVELNLPTNSSISITLEQDDLHAMTTVAACSLFHNDKLWLNGVSEIVTKDSRMGICLDELRKLRRKQEESLLAARKHFVPLSSYRLHVVSENNFPTAAGLASSAAGFAAFVYAVAGLFELSLSPEELSVFARRGSGSACRSLFGGFVAWEMGTKNDGSDSRAAQIAPKQHWPEMRAIILVASDNKKDVSSTKGMQSTVATSSLFKERINTVVPNRFKAMHKSILEKDFETFGELTMRDSNQFHAVCLDSYPPISYLNDTSRAAIGVVEEINKLAGHIVAAYTFDAGPNCVIYYLEENSTKVLGPLKTALGSLPGWDKAEAIAPFHFAEFDKRWLERLHEGISHVFITQVGDGPQKSSTSLIDSHGELLR